MPLPLFEALCLVIVVATLALMTRRRPPAELLPIYGALAVAGLIGESTCVHLYEFYAYTAPWHARLFGVPLLVPLIWPLVILSAREVVSSLAPEARRARPLLVGLLVAFDASLVEVVAVRAGLWSWAEPGHLGVPVIGILGWGYFAAVAEAVLVWGRGRPRALVAALLVPLAPLGAHALIQASWWGLFRWRVRGDLGERSLIALGVLAIVAAFVAGSLRRAGRLVPLSVAAPRMVAAGLFVALLVTTAPTSLPLWQHTLAVAIPYLAVTDLRGRSWRAVPA